jgi:hypothetical protein
MLGELAKHQPYTNNIWFSPRCVGRVATLNFSDLTTMWWAGLLQTEHDLQTQDWPTLRDYVRDNVMSKRWVEAEWLKYGEMRYRQRGNENESPAEFLSRKQRHRRKLLPIYPGASSADLAYEVADLWLHVPNTWAAHLDITTCRTSNTHT